MKRVTGIGGVFFKAEDPKRLYQWYEEHLGLKREPDGSGVVFPGQSGAMTVWSIFKKDTTYFGPGQQSVMINYTVDDLDGLLATLRKEGVEIDPKREDYDYGRFAWIVDPEGNRIDLWEPPKEESKN